ncbi:MAG: heavy metal translocating P-type ATPase [Pseudomonadota bacterium]
MNYRKPAAQRHQHHHVQPCCAGHEAPPAPAASAPPPTASALRYRVENMDCPTEEGLIRRRLEAMPGVIRLDFRLLERELTVFHALADGAVITAALRSLDMGPRLLEAHAPAEPIGPAVSAAGATMLAVSGAAALGAELLAWSRGQDDAPAVIALALLAIASAGLPTLKKAWIALRNVTLNIYFLMSLAVAGALSLGKWPEAAMVVFLFALAEAIEALSLARARQAIAALGALAPETAEIDVDGQWQALPLASVAVGARMRVRCGERVALDARVLSGRAALDQAPITGESLPVEKLAGDALYAGSVVQDGALEASVTATAGESTLARIAQAVQSAHARRAPTQRYVDQFARYYTPAVVAGALLLVLLGPWLGQAPRAAWLYQALVLLVIACPCALVVSTPVTVVSGLAAAARRGILIKGGVYLEQARLLKAIAIDKTGTLTEGKLELCDALALGELTLETALLIAASLDQHSSHPLAQALVRGWRLRQPDAAALTFHNIGHTPGRGIAGELDGQRWQLGNRALLGQNGCATAQLGAQLTAFEAQGKSVVVLCDATGAVALFAFADQLRAGSARAVAALKARGVHVAMLSGDNAATARMVAAAVGIADVQAELLPLAKQDAVSALRARYGAVGMAGDGVNDAPALARADIGIAMGAAGTASAMEAADVAIMDDDPGKIAVLIGLSARTVQVLRQNIALALGIKLLFLALALGGHATLWMAVFADMGASLLVVMNGLRLLRA